jgi:XTP/dITP diphosphohydrolase
MPSLPIIIATGNPHKVEELRAIFRTAMLDVIGLKDLPGHESFHEPEEHGLTCEENARIKALSYAAQTGRACLADDSGIEIDALRLPGGTPRPGVISSHYCTNGEERGMSRADRDAANNARVLRELEGVPPERRTARFVCCMCLAAYRTPAVTPGPKGSPTPAILHETRGTMEGRIGLPPRVPAGGNGFGYDPLFLVAPMFTHTGAELPTDEKNRLSHRGMAAREMAEWMKVARLS